MKVSPDLYQVTINTTAGWNATEDEFIEFQQRFKDFIFFDLAEFDPENKYGQEVVKKETSGIWVLSGEDLVSLAVKRIVFEVVRKIDISVDISRQLMDFAEKPIRIVSEGGSTNNYNTKCEIHMPGQALSLYNDILLVEDSCTDAISVHLQGGWRIIAVCPQPDQRRPDYILGRFNPEM